MPGTCLLQCPRKGDSAKLGESAENYAERARAIHSKFVPESNKIMICIACQHFKGNDAAAAERILSRLTADDTASCIMAEVGDLLVDRMKWYDLAALAYERCALAGSFWRRWVSRVATLTVRSILLVRSGCSTPTRPGLPLRSILLSGQTINVAGRNVDGILREIRDECGGCGAVLEGETHKYCAGCKTYCYCSRDCQKRHWNRSRSGHREECKEAGKCVIKLPNCGLFWM